MRALVAGFLACLFVMSPAWAQLPALDPEGRYRLIGPAQRTDSACIGRPDTPLCAVETLLACFARRETALCGSVWPQARGASLGFERLANLRYWWSYRVVAAEQTGTDEAVIAIAGRNCGLLLAEPDCRTTPAPATRYRVRRGQAGWEVLDWQSPPGAGAGG